LVEVNLSNLSLTLQVKKIQKRMNETNEVELVELDRNANQPSSDAPPSKRTGAFGYLLLSFAERTRIYPREVEGLAKGGRDDQKENSQPRHVGWMLVLCRIKASEQRA
jgi:hypothetical protein